MWSQSGGGGVQIIDHFLGGGRCLLHDWSDQVPSKIPHINLTSDNSLMALTSCSIRSSFQSGIRIHNWFKRGITLKLIFSSHSASLMARPVKRDLGHVKSRENWMSRMTLCSCSVIGSFYYHTNLCAVTILLTLLVTNPQGAISKRSFHAPLS